MGLVFPQAAEDVLLTRRPAYQSDLDTAGNESKADTEVAKVHRYHIPLRRAKDGHPGLLGLPRAPWGYLMLP